jgi:hypothetical protein
LKEHVEADVDDSGVEEHRNNESEPLIGMFIERDCGIVGRETAKGGEVAVIAWIVGIGACGVGARPIYWNGGILNFWDGSHARDEASAHIDKDVC